MAKLAYQVTGQNSCVLSVTELNSSSRYASVYITCNGQTSSNLAYVGSYVLTSRTWTITGLTAGTRYYASYVITSAGGNTASGGDYFTTQSAPVVGSVGTVRLTENGTGAGSVTVSWSSATNATAYRVEVYNASGGLVRSSNVTSTNTTVTGLSTGTYYQFKIFGTRSGSSNGTPSYATITTSIPVVVVGGVGNLIIRENGTGAGSVTVSWSSATNATAYRVEVYNASGGLVHSSNVTSTSQTVTGLSTGAWYEFKVFGTRSGSSNGTPSGGSIITSTPIAIGSVGTITATPSTTTTSVTLSWNTATNATSYEVSIYTNSTGALYTSTSTTNRSITISGLAENTYYRATVRGVAGSSAGALSTVYFNSRAFPPSALTGLTATAHATTKGRIDISWNTATNATGYRWEIYLGNTTNASAQVANGSTASFSATTASYSSLVEYQLYTVKAYAYRTGYSNGTPATTTVRTKDLTPPVINSLTPSSTGRMYISFSASDAHSGLRTSNRYYTEITNKNGTTYGQGAYGTDTYRTFIADGSGLTFENGAYYYMKVVAYDNENNSISDNVRVQFTASRPTNWYWHTTKVRGGVISLTASEWNSFCLKINQFRQYKKLGNYSFTSASTGGRITANIVNQARTAISAMSPPTSVPTSAVVGGEITATFFNTLSTSLNSIQ